jgi:putative ABC transport system substrate-binding protein
MADMRRREFITLIASTVAWPLAARAQQPDRGRLICVLMAYAQSDRAAQSWLAAFRGALSKLGWTEGSNLRIELRWSADDPNRIRALAKELVDLRPNAIFGVTTPVIAALARETKTIPIVFAGVFAPIGSGLAANLAHPGGNITGFMASDPAGTLGGKWVELLKEIAPRTVRIELLFNPATAVPLQFTLPSIQAAAFSFAVQVNAAPVHAKDEIEGVIAAQTRDPGGRLIVMPDVFNDVNRELIVALTARYSVPYRPPLGCGRCRPLSQTSGGLSRARTRRRVCQWRPCRDAFVASDPHRADRVRAGRRPGWRRLGRELGTARRQRHRFYVPRLWILGKMGGTAQGDRAKRYAGSGASRCRHFLGDRNVGCDPVGGFFVRDGVDSDRSERCWRDRARRHRIRACVKRRPDRDG